MLNDATCFKNIYIVCGVTDMRSGIDRLVAIAQAGLGVSPYMPDTLFMFCGRRSDRIKCITWEGDGWLLMTKRLCDSKFQWPRTESEVRSLTLKQFRWLMDGLTIDPKKSVKQVEPPEFFA